MPEPLTALVAPDWAEVLAPHEPQIRSLGDFLRAETQAGRGFLPKGENILRAFKLPLADVRVLIVGQDPYPTPGNAVGLSFSIPPEERRLPGSLRNIFTELESDLGIPPSQHGDLTTWFNQGVLLLNRVLTVQPHKPRSHHGKGWETITQAAIEALGQRGGPLVAMLWGRDAQQTACWLGDTPTITSPHPSPLSARSGFFGSRPFSKTNELLAQQGADPIDWRLPQ